MTDDLPHRSQARGSRQAQESFQAGWKPAPADLDRLIAANYRLIWAYRFVYRELSVLVRNDARLAERYRELRRRGYQGFAELIASFTQAGLLRRQKNKRDLGDLTELCWMISEQWPVNLELSGKPFDEEGIKTGARLMRSILRPLMTR